MPRDIFSPDTRDQPLVASPESGSIPASEDDHEDEYQQFTIRRDDDRHAHAQQLREGRAKTNERNELHPYVQTLSFQNLESCVQLENAVFPEQERCSEDKFLYRLYACPELCLGLFSTYSSPPDTATIPTYVAAHPADSASPEKKSTLIAMIVATKSDASSVTDESMDYPPKYRDASLGPSERRGHHEHGRTICIHTLAVLPALQKQGLGKILMKSYQQRMETSGIADRITLLAHDYLIKMYEGMSFADKGKSEVRFGGGGWNNLIYEFAEHAPGS